MKRGVFSFLIVCFCTLFLNAQDTESQYIQWFGEDTVANELTWRGMDHLMNIEFEKAMTFFQAAVDQDPSLFAPYVELALFTNDEKQMEKYKAAAKENVKGKNEVSKMFVSLLDIERGPGAGEKWSATWQKMNELAYDGPFVNFNAARFQQDDEKMMADLKALLAKEEKAGRNTGHIHNMMGYMYYANGDKDKAKAHFEKYLELRPDGYNAYDSMGEYYMNEGDHEKAMEYYKMAVAHYPMATNANEKLEELEEMMANADKGNLITIAAEYVKPEYVDEYIQWGKEYKAVAEKTGFKDFWVSRGDQAFYYGSSHGKEMEDVEDFNASWEKWFEENPELGQMWEKYKHTVYKSEQLVWRHLPKHSYNPDEGNDSPNAYSRIYYAYVKYGHGEEALDVLKKFKKLWTENNVKEGFNVYQNVYGKADNCIAIVTNYQSREDWIADEKDVMEKVGGEKVKELMNEWNKHIKYGENSERWPMPDLAHQNVE